MYIDLRTMSNLKQLFLIERKLNKILESKGWEYCSITFDWFVHMTPYLDIICRIEYLNNYPYDFHNKSIIDKN